MINMIFRHDYFSFFKSTLSRFSFRFLMGIWFMSSSHSLFIFSHWPFKILIKIVYFSLEWKSNGINFLFILCHPVIQIMWAINDFEFLFFEIWLMFSNNTWICYDFSLIKVFLRVLISKQFDFISYFT